MQENPVPSKNTTKQNVTTSGIWMIVYSITGRVSKFIGQFVLAWLLIPEQLGLIALANGLTAMVSLVQQFGLADVLVNRYRKFHLWSSAGFTLSCILGIGTTVIMLMLAVGASYVYEDRLLGWVIAVMSLAAPINAIGIIPLAKLRGEMEFRKIAVVQSLGVILGTFCTLFFAWLGLGVFCIAGAILVETIFRNLQIMRIARLGFPKKLSLAHTKYLMADSLHVYTQSFFNNVVLQGDYLLLGLFATKTIVGLYFMAYTLSVQAISLIAQNLTTVLFSAFTTFADAPERLRGAFVRSSRLLAFACAPICVAQAVVAEPLVHLLLQPKWHEIVPLVQILCLGTAFRCASFSWDSMLKAQRKFSLVANFSIFAACSFLILIVTGCYLGGATGCAIACASYSVLVSPLQLFAAFSFAKDAWKQVLDLSFRSLGIAGFSYGVAWLLSGPAREAHMLVMELAISLIVGSVLYLGISWKVNSAPLKDFVEVIIQIIRKGSLRRSTASV